MRTILTTALVLLTATLASAAPPVDLKGKTVAQYFGELLPKLGEKDAQQKWQDLCFQAGAPGNEKLRAEVCQLMAGKLASETPEPARLWLLDQLRRIGRAECVDAVAALLDDRSEPVRVEALRCLASNPAPEATAKLTARVAASTGTLKVGLLNALGTRGDRAAVETVAKELASMETAVAVAAARALGRIPGPESLKALNSARAGAAGAVKLAVCDAVLLHADRMFKESKAAEALALYRELSKPEEPRPIRLAALRGQLAASGDDAGALVLRIFAGTDRDAQEIAVAQLETLPAGALKALAADMGKLPPAGQVLVLTGLAARGDKSQASAVVAALKSPDAGVKRAAVRALGRLGDAAVVADLLEIAQGNSPLKGDAVESLVQLADDAATARLVEALAGEKAAARFAVLADILERRKAARAVPALLKAAQANEALRGPALAALRALAEPDHIPALVEVLVKAGKDREAAELAVVAACQRVARPERRVEHVLAVYEKGSSEQKVVLLPVLGRLGGMDALRALRAAVAASDAATAEAGATALLLFPEPAASEDLLRLAREAKQDARRKQALAALVRINGVVSEYPAAERLATLKEAMKLAQADDERRLILEQIGFVRHLDTLRYVLPYLDDKALEQAACKAVVELAHSRMLREPNRAEFVKALDRVLAVCKDKGLVDRAKGYKQAP